MLIKEIGEFNLIKRMSAILGAPRRSVIAGIGDDAAVLRPPEGKLLLVTTDMLVEDVHFSLATATAFQIGWKSLAANISDVAAMGGEPTYAFVSIGFPRDTTAEFVDELYSGMSEIAEEYSVDIVGGDTVSSPEVIINVSLLGEVEEKNCVLRSGAKPGDAICVTGDVGGSSAGLEILQRGLSIKGTEKHLMPKPRVREGRLLARSSYVTSMIDVSDGVASEIHHVCEQSKTGAHILMKDIPLSSNILPVAKLINKNPYDFALSGGEDYELLFTCYADRFQFLQNQVFRTCGTHITRIGYILYDSASITIEDEYGKTTSLEPKGYDHFASSKSNDYNE
jgi:thiamine-monophosphate kinase